MTATTSAPQSHASRTAASPQGTPGTAAPGGAADRAPPAWLPGSHFAAALGFLSLGVAALVVFAPDLARGYYLAPRVAALTHLFTLGWITTSIMAALYQFLPVALDQPIRSVRVAMVTLALYAPGLLLFVTGLGTGRSAVMLAGAALFGAGLLLFIGNLSATLARSRARDVTWWALACATFFLAVTLVLGLALAGNLRWGYLGAGRIGSLGVHLHVALAGWVLLVMIGVARRLLPMFLLSHDAQDRFARAAVVLVATGAGMLAFLHHAPPPFSRWLPALCIAGGCVSFLEQARRYFAGRHRKKLDAGMRLAACGIALLGVSLLLAVPVVVQGGSAGLRVGYVASVLLAMTLFVAAHYYRIVPFLTWYHRFGPLAGRRPLPRVNELFSARIANVAVALLASGAALLVVAILAGAPSAARGAAVVFAAGGALEIVQMIGLWRTKP